MIWIVGGFALGLGLVLYGPQDTWTFRFAVVPIYWLTGWVLVVASLVTVIVNCAVGML